VTEPLPQIWRARFSALLTCVLGIQSGFGAPSFASAEPLPALDAPIPAQALATALASLARQTGLHVLYVSSELANHSSRPVAAGTAADDALDHMLEGSGLVWERLTARSIRIRTQEPRGPPQLAQAADHSALATVIVTGSRIPVPANIAASGPTYVVTAEQIRLQGSTDTADVVNALPQVISSATADFGNHSSPAAPAGGFTTVDLRGLGPQRTVVLIDGRRLGIGDPNTGNPAPAPNLDQIPVAMIERVEVLTGGASAAYGSDAVAGVVNFILKDHIQGVQLDGQVTLDQHAQHSEPMQAAELAAGFSAPYGTVLDGARRDLSVLAGTAFGEKTGALTGYFVYHRQNPLYGADRDFSSCPADSNSWLTGIPTEAGISCAKNPQSNLFITSAGLGNAYSVLGNQFVPFPASGSIPPPYFNTATDWTTQRADTRYQAGFLSHLDLGRSLQPYAEFSFMQDQSDVYLSPSGLFNGGNPLTANGSYLINCSNPLLSAQQASLLCTPAQIAADSQQPGSVSAALAIGRRSIESGGRLQTYRHVSYRGVMGIAGDVAETWRYDLYGLYYRTSLFETFQNFLSNRAIANALQVTTSASGQARCISGGNCVPYDIFATGAVTAQQLAYVTGYASGAGANSELIASAQLTGQLSRYGVITPWAEDGAVVNMGAEHRSDSLVFSPDAVAQSTDLSGFGLSAVALDKSVAVNEMFTEVRMPLAQRIQGLDDLTIDAGYRYSDHSIAGVTNTYKFDLEFAPVRQLRLRAVYDHVVRVPNIIELYTPLYYSISDLVTEDPCAPTNGGSVHAAASLEQCRHTGVTAAQYGNGYGPAYGGTNTIVQCADSCGVVSGGNPALQPETADTWSLGTTIAFDQIAGLTGSLDYYRIRLNGKIGTVPETVTLNECLATGSPQLCQQIVRTASGALGGSSVAGGGYILADAVNTGAALVSGVDVQLAYSLPIGPWGRLTWNLIGSLLHHNEVTPYAGSPSYDCAGLFGATCLGGSVNPTWRHNLRITWTTPWQTQLSLQWRFIGGTGFDNNSRQPVLEDAEEGTYDPYLQRIPNYSYLDLAALCRVGSHAHVRIGVNNLFDKDPPLLPQEISGAAGVLNTFPVYDVLGRNIFFDLSATF
jgi:iron complex outermembrane recepter protein